MKLLFIINPIAGKGNTKDAIPVIKSFCKQRGIQYTIIETSGPRDATRIVKEHSSAYSAVVAVGGDGTVLEVSNGLTGTDIPLGILPLGRGNDFARAMNIPISFTQVEKALEIITENTAQYVDLVAFNVRVFLNIASVGFDAEIIQDLHKVKRFIKGKAAYFISVFLKFLTYKPKDVELLIDGEKIATKVFLTAVCNGICYGGGMMINPNGSVTDGLLDVIVISPVPRYKIPFLLLKFIKGNHLSLPYVTSYQCKEVQISSQEPLPVNVDGESPMNTPISLLIKPLSIRVFGNT
ncbi:MAG: diacylglycerol kinase family lipid kinase [Clostridiales bacterium]|nr:diacylglycerol kinase family lipid kinase [Clostridiales bacterium]